MGDRCSLYITFRKSDEPKFCSALGENWYDAVEQEEETWIEVSVEEANYAMYEDREKLARAGLLWIPRIRGKLQRGDICCLQWRPNGSSFLRRATYDRGG